MAALKLKLLGRFEARLKDGPSLDLPTTMTQLLVAFLALNTGEAQPREKLASLLWSDRGDEQARHSLRDALSGLRKALGAAGVRDGWPNTASKKELRLATRPASKCHA